MFRKTAITAALAALTLTASACNTVEGVGEDIKSVANTGERAID